MTVLLLRLAGPMQSWGTQSRFTVRDTEREPSKSGVVGLLCAACGIPRHDASRLAELARLPMGVRVDREGVPMCDYHTAGGGTRANGTPYGVAKASGAAPDTVTSTRYYLADARFLAALEGPRVLLEKVYLSLTSPVWPIYLGRKSFVPGENVWLPDGLREGDLKVTLASYPWCQRRGEKDPGRLRLVLECERGVGQPRLDVPLCFESSERRFGLRFVRTEWVLTSEIPRAQEDNVTCTSQG